MRPAAIANLLGDLWLNNGLQTEPDFVGALAVPEVSLHLYEKHTARAGRKMGHLSATADTATEAVARVLEARRRL
jgi:5-(carboxyamino)imidazole ribonucleotide synthase